MPSKQPNKLSPGTRSKLVLLGLVFIFVSPILIAWAYTAGYIDLSAPARTNRGLLVTPPLDLRENPATNLLFERAKLQPGEWMLAYLSPGPCTSECAAALNELKTIRSLLGYSGQRVHTLAITAIGLDDDPQHSLGDSAVAGALDELLQAQVGPLAKAQIVMIDWRKQLVLRYDYDTQPIDIKKDLKKLLRASQIR